MGNEIGARACPWQPRRSRQRLGEGAHYGSIDEIGVAKANLEFLRVDVDVHGPGVDVDVDHHHGVAATLDHAAIPIENGSLQHAVAYETPVDEEPQTLGIAAIDVRARHDATDADPVTLAVEGVESTDFGPQGGLRPCPQVRGCRDIDQASFACRDHQAGAPRAQHCSQRRFAGVRLLGRIRTHELAARRCVEQELRNVDGGANGHPDFLHPGQRPSGYAHPGTNAVVTAPRGEYEVRHRGDRGEGLAAKTHRGNREKVLGVRQLARGVPQRGARRIDWGHTAAVVGDDNSGQTAALEVDLDSVGARVQSVFNELFDHRGRALDNLARGDAIDNVVAEYTDDAARGDGR